jgi:uncharacterized protein
LRRAEVSTLVLLGAYNLLVNRVLPPTVHVPANLSMAAGLAILCRRAGCSFDDLGLDRDRFPKGLRTGLIAGGVIAAGVAGTASIPTVRHFFNDERVRDIDLRDAVYEVAVRIPLATALAEEVAFRGALMGVMGRLHSRPTAVLRSSAAFGLWHLSPSIRSLAHNPAGRSAGDHPTKRAVAVAISVVLTGIAGAGFAWLRDRSGSVAAPALAHLATNVSAFVTAHWVVRNEGEGGAELPIRNA